MTCTPFGVSFTGSAYFAGAGSFTAQGSMAMRLKATYFLSLLFAVLAVILLITAVLSRNE